MSDLCRIFFVVLSFAATSTTVFAQSGSAGLEEARGALASGKPVEALDATLDAAATIAQSLPFTIHRASLTQSPATGFGMDVERNDNVFAPGEEVDLYLEPRGYAFATRGERYEFGFSFDLLLVDDTGNILGGQDNFGSRTYESRQRNLESYIQITLGLDGVPPGKYALRVRVHDLMRENVSATQDLPIEIDG